MMIATTMLRWTMVGCDGGGMGGDHTFGAEVALRSAESGGRRAWLEEGGLVDGLERQSKEIGSSRMGRRYRW